VNFVPSFRDSIVLYLKRDGHSVKHTKPVETLFHKHLSRFNMDFSVTSHGTSHRNSTWPSVVVQACIKVLKALDQCHKLLTLHLALPSRPFLLSV
jgi:nitroimidazol reductase NimA-like FMN-containing flavoprotein (pyridoxamine 5'-phosphate oxidase superfamily)